MRGGTEGRAAVVAIDWRPSYLPSRKRRREKDRGISIPQLIVPHVSVVAANFR